MITAEQARSLAVCYHTFAATPFDDHSTIIVWGEMLRDVQIETGVEMYPADVLSRWIADAHRRESLAAFA